MGTRWVTNVLRLVAVAMLVVAASASYVVKEGDTLSSIAAELRVSARKLAEINAIEDPNRIFVGQVLRTPAEVSPIYEVRPGDTLLGIAVEVGASVSDLTRFNKLSDANVIVVGQVLLTKSDKPPRGIDLAPPIPGTHLVRSGESFRQIALDEGTNIETLIRANGLYDRKLIAGTRINTVLPEVEFNPQKGHVHVVKAGESLSVIAADHVTTMARLVARNGIEDANLITVGQEIAVHGDWLCPVPAGSFNRSWGHIKPDGRTHRGIDIFAPLGTPIVAPVSGSVSQVTGGVGGKQLTLVGDDGFTYFGSHLDEFGVAGAVEAGDVIGAVGTTGNAGRTSPHLHFQVHYGAGSETANPYAALAAACG